MNHNSSFTTTVPSGSFSELPGGSPLDQGHTNGIYQIPSENKEEAMSICDAMNCSHPAKFSVEVTVSDDAAISAVSSGSGFALNFCGTHRNVLDRGNSVQVNHNGPFQVSPQSTGGKGGMKLVHILRTCPELVDEGICQRHITNVPTPAEEEAFLRSLETSNVETIGESKTQKLVAINIGDQHMPLLERAAELGLKFRFMSVPVKALAERHDLVETWIARSNFAWANASTACFIKFDGDVEPGYWGLEPLGIRIVGYDAKLAKRLNEITRVTRHSFLGDIDMREFPTPAEFIQKFGEEDAPKVFDGMNFISRSFAATLGLINPDAEDESDDILRVNIRASTPLGLIKGDADVVDDEFIGCDLVYHTANLKAAVRTDGWTLVTCMAHAPLHELRHDDQSRANFEYFLTPERVYEDLNEMVRAFKVSVSEGGDLAKYLSQQMESFEDPIAVDYDRFGTAQRIEETAKLLKEVGIAPASFSNITYMRLGAIVRKMESSRVYENGMKTNFFKKMAIPAGNAISGGINTYESCTLMGGVEFPRRDGTKTFFDTRYGIIMPASRFLTTYELHGGWDLDDTVGLFLIKVYCTNPEHLARLTKAGVLDPAISVPEEKSEAIEVGLMIRRPNGPGEYSIEAIDASTMPWLHYNADRIEVVDLAGAPDGVDDVYANTEILGLDAMVEIPLRYTRHVAEKNINAQTENPGVGMFANLMLSWVKTFGTGNLPKQIVERMEAVVDAVQQTADPEAFAHIIREIRRLWEEFVRLVIETSTPVDVSLLKAGRIPRKLGARDQVKIGDAIAEAGLVYSGDWTRIQNRYAKAVVFCENLAKTTANEARNGLPLAQRIRSEKFGPMYKSAVQDAIKASLALKTLGAQQRNLEATAGDNVILQRVFQTKGRIELEKFMDEFVNNISSKKQVDPHRFMLALYKYIVTSRSDWPNGEPDRIFVQPSSPGHKSMMELFLEALELNGILIDIIDPV